MKLQTLFICMAMFTACAEQKEKTYVLNLKPSGKEIQQYQYVQSFQLATKGKEGETKTYIKHFIDYNVAFGSKDSMITQLITLHNFRIEYEDGNGVQVFDTKFDNPDFIGLDSRIYFSMKDKTVTAVVTQSGKIVAVRGTDAIKKQLLKAYKQYGLNPADLEPVTDQLLEKIIRNQLVHETVSFYNNRAIIKDSSYSFSTSITLPVSFDLLFNYKLRQKDENTILLSGKGTALLTDTALLQQSLPGAIKKNQGDCYDEIQLHWPSGVLKYRKIFLTIHDTIQKNNQPLPVVITIEKEIAEKKKID